ANYGIERGCPIYDGAPKLAFWFPPFEPVDHLDLGEGVRRFRTEHLPPPGALDVEFRVATVDRSVEERRGLGPGHRLDWSGGVNPVKIRHRSLVAVRAVVRTCELRGELARLGHDVFPPRPGVAPVVECHADPVDGIIARVIRHIRIITSVQDPV